MGTLVGIFLAAAVALPISGFGPVCAGSDLFPTVTASTCFAEEDLGGDGLVEADEERKADGERPSRDADSGDSKDKESDGEDRKPRDDKDKGKAKDAGGTQDNGRAVGGDRDGF